MSIESRGVAFITGASRGIGRSIAQRLSQDGFKVALFDVDGLSQDLLQVSKEIQASTGNQVESFIGDVTVIDTLKAAMKKAVEKMGPLKVVVANAGILRTKTLMDSEAEDYEAIFKVNVIGVHNTIKIAAQIMVEQGDGGKILTAGSAAGHKPDHELCAYSASKWAVRGLTQAAAKELGQYNILVNSYCPGIIYTDMWKDIEQAKDKMESAPIDTAQEHVKKESILKRVGQADEVANAVAWLSSADNTYMTGQSVPIDGGIVLT